jgi:hypothetical protein
VHAQQPDVGSPLEGLGVPEEPPQGRAVDATRGREASEAHGEATGLDRERAGPVEDVQPRVASEERVGELAPLEGLEHLRPSAAPLDARSGRHVEAEVGVAEEQERETRGVGRSAGVDHGDTSASLRRSASGPEHRRAGQVEEAPPSRARTLRLVRTWVRSSRVRSVSSWRRFWK